ncbi:hypothetical protein EDD86DRAFT_203867 [Gorgonomyces haynaldii]|nr:hypothetical protein EDD86DRAFT_203867 [Gorgonomyces haynaldii]
MLFRPLFRLQHRILRPYSIFQRPLLYRQPVRQITGKQFTEMFRKYGLIVIGTYATLSFTFFCGCFTSVLYFDISANDIARVFDNITTFLGFEKSEHGESTWFKYVIGHLPEWARTPRMIDIYTNVLLAMAMNELFVPLRIGLTAGIVPYVARYLRRPKLK